MRVRTIPAVRAVVGLLAGLPAAASTAAPRTTKPHAGQICSPKKKAPKGFRCVKVKGKYRLKEGLSGSRAMTAGSAAGGLPIGSHRQETAAQFSTSASWTDAISCGERAEVVDDALTCGHARGLLPRSLPRRDEGRR
jgi:hypothetical protein